MPRKHSRSVASSWQTEDTKKKPDAVQLGTEIDADDFDSYDPDAFYMRASDYNGHSKNIQINLPTTFSSAIQKVVESASNPYKSASDMARDFIIHGLVRSLQRMSQVGEEVPTFWFAEAQLDESRFIIEGQMKYLDQLEQDGELFTQAGEWRVLNMRLCDAEANELGGTLAKRRDEIVRKYRSKFPKNWHPSWDL